MFRRQFSGPSQVLGCRRRDSDVNIDELCLVDLYSGDSRRRGAAKDLLLSGHRPYVPGGSGSGTHLGFVGLAGHGTK